MLTYDLQAVSQSTSSMANVCRIESANSDILLVAKQKCNNQEYEQVSRTRMTEREREREQ